MMENLKQTLQLQLNELMNQWHENGRLRLAGWVVLAILVGYLILLTSDWATARKDDLIQANRDLIKMQEVSQQSFWLERVVQAEDSLSQLQERLWKASDAALARADIQAWLDAQTKKAGLSNVRINVMPIQTLTGSGPTVKIEAQVRAAMEPQRLAQFLYLMENEPRFVSVDFLELTNMAAKSINLQLSFYFQPAGT